MQTTHHDTINGWATIRNRFGFGTTNAPTPQRIPAFSKHSFTYCQSPPTSTPLHSTPNTLVHPPFESPRPSKLHARHPIPPAAPVHYSLAATISCTTQKLDNHMQTSAAHGPPAPVLIATSHGPAAAKSPSSNPVNLLRRQTLSTYRLLRHFVRFLGTQ